MNTKAVQTQSKQINNKGGGFLGDMYSVAVIGKQEKRKKKEKIVFLVH